MSTRVSWDSCCFIKFAKVQFCYEQKSFGVRHCQNDVEAFRVEYGVFRKKCSFPHFADRVAVNGIVEKVASAVLRIVFTDHAKLPRVDIHAALPHC